jgi:hypothetical protein
MTDLSLSRRWSGSATKPEKTGLLFVEASLWNRLEAQAQSCQSSRQELGSICGQQRQDLRSPSSAAPGGGVFRGEGESGNGTVSGLPPGPEHHRQELLHLQACNPSSPFTGVWIETSGQSVWCRYNHSLTTPRAGSERCIWGDVLPQTPFAPLWRLFLWRTNAPSSPVLLPLGFFLAV